MENFKTGSFWTEYVEIHILSLYCRLGFTLEILNSMQKSRGEGTSLIATLKAEREELDSSLSKEKLQTLHLKQELADAETRNTDLYKVIT
jgi:hypothetical protein